MITRIETTLPGVLLLEPRVFEDARGFFMETYHARDFHAAGVPESYVQDNHSRSARYTLRGLHYQLGRPQAKLVRVIRGEVFDVAVDIRRGGPAFGRWFGARLSEANRRIMYIPAGFAHGFVALADATELVYKCSDFYAPAQERGLAWNDPRLGIAWPLPAGRTPALSAKDAGFRALDATPETDLPRFMDQPA
jgi:dTDP-4-dehydrorhamnose 3,5-epimerase